MSIMFSFVFLKPILLSKSFSEGDATNKTKRKQYKQYMFDYVISSIGAKSFTLSNKVRVRK